MNCGEIEKYILVATLVCQLIIFIKTAIIVYLQLNHKKSLTQWQSELTHEVKRISRRQE
jgi:hypothetical protein